MTRPEVTNAPGLAWKKRRRDQWEARWQARSDLVKKGFEPRSVKLWLGVTPNGSDTTWIQHHCQTLQSKMLVWSGDRGEAVRYEFDDTLRSLVACYQTNPASPYRKLRYVSRKNYNCLTARLEKDHGGELLSNVRFSTLTLWHEAWCEESGVPMAHALVGMLRGLMTFGLTVLENKECERAGLLLSKMKFPNPRPQKQTLTADQAVAIRTLANKKGLHSMALAQALQFEIMLRQRDVIGEWVPLDERVTSDVIDGNRKWARGLRWNEIDANLVLKHVTSKRQKPLTVPLRLAPMVMEELARFETLPTSGPVVIRERTGLPYTDDAYRRTWRMLADECGIPKNVQNMDSRSGGITEASNAGADMEHIRQAATHSDIATTQGYNRDAATKIEGVMRKRVAHRNSERT